MNNSIFSKIFSPRARTLDPTTSHEAAEALKESTVDRHFKLIHDALKLRGPMGKDMISIHCRLDPNQVARRLPEMARKDLVELTGNLVHSASGRNEREWKAK